MDELQIFENEEFGKIRTMLINDEPWFVGKDVAEALGYSNSSKAVLDHVDDEDKTFTMLDIADSQNGNVLVGQSKTALINESGLYSLIMSSKLPSAKRFKRWVTSEVLPAIRKTGSYSLKPKATRPLTTDDYVDAARIVARCCSGRLPIVLELLEKAGLEIPKIKEQIPERQIIMRIPDSVSEFLESVSKDYIIGVPTEQVYEDYVSRCNETGTEAAKKITFSKCVNQEMGTETKVSRVGERKCRIYVEIGGE